MKNLKVIIIAVIIIVLGFVLMWVFTGMKKKPEAKQIVEEVKYYNTDFVHYSDHRAMIHSLGKLKAYNKIEVYSEVGGNVLNHNPKFKVGNFFKQGQIMIDVDDADARMNLYAQKSDFLSLLTRTLPDIKADFPDAYDKWNNYLENYNIEKKMKDLPTVTNPKEKYFLAARNIYKSFYTIKNAEIRLDKYKIKAPFDGYVTQSLIEVGTSIRMGQKLGEFSGINHFELELPVNSSQTKFISIGNEVEIKREDGSGHWSGKVTRISENIDLSSQTQNVYVSVYGNDLVDGMYLDAVIYGNYIKNTYKINRKAIFNNQYIYYLKDSLLAIQPINIIYSDENYSYINGIDSLKPVITDQVVNVPLGIKIIPINKNSEGAIQ